MSILSEQELHNLAMNIVGKDLEKLGFEFLAVNSKLKKNPQFVALKDKKLHFVIVRAVSYPHNPAEYNRQILQKMKKHAEKFNACTYYAGVGLANQQDYDKPLHKEENYIVKYNGLIKIQ